MSIEKITTKFSRIYDLIEEIKHEFFLIPSGWDRQSALLHLEDEVMALINSSDELAYELRRLSEM